MDKREFSPEKEIAIDAKRAMRRKDLREGR